MGNRAFLVFVLSQTQSQSSVPLNKSKKIAKGNFDEDGDFLMPVVNSAVIFNCSAMRSEHKVKLSDRFLKHWTFQTNVNSHHVRIPVYLTTILNALNISLQTIKDVISDVYKNNDEKNKTSANCPTIFTKKSVLAHSGFEPRIARTYRILKIL